MLALIVVAAYRVVIAIASYSSSDRTSASGVRGKSAIAPVALAVLPHATAPGSTDGTGFSRDGNLPVEVQRDNPPIAPIELRGCWYTDNDRGVIDFSKLTGMRPAGASEPASLTFCWVPDPNGRARFHPPWIGTEDPRAFGLLARAQGVVSKWDRFKSVSADQRSVVIERSTKVIYGNRAEEEIVQTYDCRHSAPQELACAKHEVHSYNHEPWFERASHFSMKRERDS
jgi:hypothetical protein